MADEAQSGPRRARVERLTDGRKRVTYEDTGQTVIRESSLVGLRVSIDPTAAASPNRSNVSMRKQKAAILSAASSVNLFSRPVVISDPQIVAMQRAKTRLFIPVFSCTSIIILLVYLLSPTTTRLSPNISSYDDYLAVQGYSPSCPCSGQQLPTMADAANVTIPAWADFDQNACKTLNALYNDCFYFPNYTAPTAVSPCLLTAAAGSFTRGFLPLLQSPCATMSTAAGAMYENFMSSGTGPVLLAPRDLQALANVTLLKEVQKAFIVFLAALTPIRVNANLALTSMFELTNGTNPADRLPANCTCAGQASTLLPITGNLDDDLCVFPIAFDWRPKNVSTIWSCFPAFFVRQFPIQLLAPQLYSMLNLPTDPDGTYGRYSYAMLPGFDSFEGMLGAYAYAMANPTSTALNGGILTVSHLDHFKACAPQTCSYTTTTRPSIIQGITTALGVITGVQTILLLLVDRGMDVLGPRCCKSCVTHQGGSSGGDDDDDASAAEAGDGGPSMELSSPGALPVASGPPTPVMPPQVPQQGGRPGSRPLPPGPPPPPPPAGSHVVPNPLQVASRAY